MRFLPLRFVTSILMVLQLTSCATVQPKQAADYDANLIGVWQGKIAITDHPEETLECRLNITGDKTSVWVMVQGQWREAKPGAFHLKAHKSNAVIFANDSGADEEGTWVESWVFVVTLLDRDELLVEWSRVVNNVDMPGTARGSKFAVHGTGTIKREPPARLPP